jgi:hypothetical protein
MVSEVSALSKQMSGRCRNVGVGGCMKTPSQLRKIENIATKRYSSTLNMI